MPRKSPVYTPLEPRPCDLPAADLASQGGMTIPEAAEFLRVSVSKAEKLVAAGDLPSAKVGRRRVISKVGCERYFAQQLAAK